MRGAQCDGAARSPGGDGGRAPESLAPRELESVEGRHDSKLRALLVNDPNFLVANPFVNACESIGDNPFLPASAGRPKVSKGCTRTKHPVVQKLSHSLPFYGPGVDKLADRVGELRQRLETRIAGVAPAHGHTAAFGLPVADNEHERNFL